MRVLLLCPSLPHTQMVQLSVICKLISQRAAVQAVLRAAPMPFIICITVMPRGLNQTLGPIVLRTICIHTKKVTALKSCLLITSLYCIYTVPWSMTVKIHLIYAPAPGILHAKRKLRCSCHDHTPDGEPKTSPGHAPHKQMHLIGSCPLQSHSLSSTSISCHILMLKGN